MQSGGNVSALAADAVSGQMLRTERHANNEYGSLLRDAFHRYGATMQLDQFLHQRQSDPRAFMRARFCIFHPMKAFKNARQFMAGNAPASIPEGQKSFILHLSRGDFDFPLKRGFQSIGREG